MQLGDQGKSFAPQIVCKKCSSNMSMFAAGKLKKLPFNIPMSWREQSNHHDDCYFCMTNIAGFNRKNAKHIMYPDIKSAIRPFSSIEFDQSSTTISTNSEDDCHDFQSVISDNIDEECQAEEISLSKGINQQQLDHLVRVLGLSKNHARIAGSTLKKYGVLAPETRFTCYKQRDLQYVQYFKTSATHGFVYCSDIPGLLDELSISSDVRKDWWLWIDGSKLSVKAVLLHNNTSFPSIPIAYSRQAKESYDTMKNLLYLVNYDHYMWDTCGDFKMIGILTGLQAGYTKFCCYLCLWDSRQRTEHYVKDQWPLRINRYLGQANIKNNVLVPVHKILLPVLHIKLGLFKNFVKALKPDGEPVAILRRNFPSISSAKLKEGIFIGPQIRKMMKDQVFKDSLSTVENRAWEALLSVVQNFLGIFQPY